MTHQPMPTGHFSRRNQDTATYILPQPRIALPTTSLMLVFVEQSCEKCGFQYSHHKILTTSETSKMYPFVIKHWWSYICQILKA